MRDDPDFDWMCEKERQAAIYFNNDYSIPKKIWIFADLENIMPQPVKKDEKFILSCARADLMRECNRLKYDPDVTTSINVKRLFHECTAAELERCTKNLRKK